MSDWDYLELLALLNPQSSRVENVAVSSQRIVVDVERVPVVGGKALVGAERQLWKSEELKRMKHRSDSAPRSGSRGGREQAGICREDVIAALAGLSPMAEMAVYALIGQLSVEQFADKTEAEAHGIALSSNRDLIAQFKPVDFFLVWKEASRDVIQLNNPCRKCKGLDAHCHVCGGKGVVARSAREMAVAADVSQTKWRSISSMMVLCLSILDAQFSDVRAVLCHHFSTRSVA